MKILCCLMSYEITKGMKSRGPIGLLKKNNNSDELILKQIDGLNKLFKENHICVVTGFGAEKIEKRLPPGVSIIENDKFHCANQAYAIKLFLKHISDIDEYSGIFILNSDVIIKKIPHIEHSKSWIVTKPKHNRNKNEHLLGAGLDNEQKLNTIFYGVGNTLWCNAVYLCKDDVTSIRNDISLYYDNMFLFELINKFIDSYDPNITQNQINSSSDCIIIRGPKDKHKII